MSVADVETFKAEIMDLCHRVLAEDNASVSQAKMFKNLVKDIVFDTLNINVLPNCKTVSESVSQSNNTMSVADIETFKAEIMDLCHRVLAEDNASVSQAKMFKNLVKDIVFDTLNINVLPNN